MPEAQPSGRKKLAGLSSAAEGGSGANLFRRRRLRRHSKVSRPEPARVLLARLSLIRSAVPTTY
jgi:hypothetical protein